VPAGNDVFDEQLMQAYLAPLAADLGLSWDSFMAYGRDHEVTDSSAFCMTVSALKSAGFSNGVSELHAGVSREMWSSLWPDLPAAEVPVAPITNGVHLSTWISPELGDLYDRYLGPGWRFSPLQDTSWDRVGDIPGEELWQVHCARRALLVGFARRRLAAGLATRGAPAWEVDEAAAMLSPDALTIGFARRFATYKRATLLFRDIERLAQLLGDSERPVQVLIAGKAHPRDDGGKNLIRDIVHAVRDPRLKPHVVFIEDYDLALARFMVRGCDIWLNTPRRPLEASGTSGMKAIANGGLHLSTLDGWWAEAYAPELGWAIGAGEVYDDEGYQDAVEGDSLFDQIEHEIVPLFWDRGSDGLPLKWIERMKASIRTLVPRFSSNRMLRDYIDHGYLPAHRRCTQLAAGEYTAARELAHWRGRVLAGWDAVRIACVEIDPSPDSRSMERVLGQWFTVTAEVELGALTPEDLRVEVYMGTVDAQGKISGATSIEMRFRSYRESGESPAPATRAVFTADVDPESSGHFGLTVRVFPMNSLLPGPHATYQLKWAPG
jgi:starch phosphorylase